MCQFNTSCNLNCQGNCLAYINTLPNCTPWYPNNYSSCRIPSCVPNIQNCGCPIQLDGNCVFYNGATLSCSGVASGSTLSSALQTLDAKICSITPSGVLGIVVQGVSGQTSVVTSAIGSTTYYTVGISPNITNQLSSLNSQVNSINNTLTGVTTTLTTSTPGMTLTKSGNTWDIEYAGASANCTGTIYSDFSLHSSNVNLVMISNIQNFTNTPCPSIKVGDEIIYRLVGQYATASVTPVFSVQLLNGNTVVQTQSGSPVAGASNENIPTAFSIEIRLFIIDITSGNSRAIMNCYWFETLGAPEGASSNNGINALSTNKQVIGASVTGLDLANLGFKVSQTAGTGTSSNFINVFVSEVFKHY